MEYKGAQKNIPEGKHDRQLRHFFCGTTANKFISPSPLFGPLAPLASKNEKSTVSNSSSFLGFFSSLRIEFLVIYLPRATYDDL